MIVDNLASYEPDMAAMIDTQVEILADRYGVSLKLAEKILKDRENATTEASALMLGQVIGQLMTSNNLDVMLHALAIAAGLDQLNGAKTETEIALELGVTRALLSHYVIGWRDLLSGKQYHFDVMKIRKANITRETYSKQTKSPLLESKRELIRKLKKCKSPQL